MMNKSGNRSLRVQISVFHPSATLDQIRQVLGHAGDEGWSVGDPYTYTPKSTRIRRTTFTAWTLTVKADSLYDMEQAMLDLRARMAPIEPRLPQLPAGSSVSLTVLLDHDNDVLGLGWDADTVRWLASLGAYIDVSLVVSQGLEPENSP